MAERVAGQAFAQACTAEVMTETPATCEALLASGAKPNEPDASDRTPLQWEGQAEELANRHDGRARARYLRQPRRKSPKTYSP